MRGRFDLLAVFAVGLACASPAQTRDQTTSRVITLKAGRLADALRELSTRTGTGLLFDPEVVGDRHSSRVSSATSVDEALQLLLAGSGLAFRRTDAGTIVIYRLALPQRTATEQELAVPEILVIGRRTQNADIRRSQNDIQPYQVLMKRDIASSHPDNVDEFLRTKLSNNASQQAFAQSPLAGLASNQSVIDLYGIGPEQTLVEIDGARMPAIPSQGLSQQDRLKLEQPDLNALPLLAIDRIETRTGTAGGIYGPGATGGVVNVVLGRDYRGVDLSGTVGLSGKGDGFYRRFEALAGFSPDEGRTSVNLAFSYSKKTGLKLGDRDYPLKSIQLRVAQNDLRALQNSLDGIIVLGGTELSLKPEFGGAGLGSAFTYMPIGTSGVAGDGGAALVANAGRFPGSLSRDERGQDQSLTTDSETISLLANVRHDFGGGFEGFIDFIGTQNRGHSQFGGLNNLGLLQSSNPFNPFRQNVAVVFPTPGFNSSNDTRLRTARLSAGVIVPLPHAWKGQANFSWGRVNSRRDAGLSLLNNKFSPAMLIGAPGAGGEPAPNPFGNWETFVAALEAYKIQSASRDVRTNHFRDASLRLGGPLFSTKAGPVSISLLAERRREAFPPAPEITENSGSRVESVGPPFSQAVWSGYGELRVPILMQDAGPRLIRGLEVQLAARYDQIKSVAEARLGAASISSFSGKQRATAFTAGLRFYPRNNLMVRASAATGILPPTPQQLVTTTFQGFAGWEDPKRGNTETGTEAPYRQLEGGSPDLKPSRARTLSIGAVLNPEGGNQPRVSLDYSRIEMHDEIIRVLVDGLILDLEDKFPGRVQRAPLTPEDIAKGYTGGVVTQLDATSFNAGQTTIDVIDLRGDYSTRLWSAGTLRFYGSLTWQPRLKRRLILDVPPRNLVGQGNGPLEWRGNGGIEWTRGLLNVALQGQFYSRYFATTSVQLPPIAQLKKKGVDIPPQFYLDLSAAYRFGPRDGPNSAPRFELQAAVKNLLNHAPPIATNTNYGYSFYGDAGMRRFQATLLAHF